MHLSWQRMSPGPKQSTNLGVYDFFLPSLQNRKTWWPLWGIPPRDLFDTWTWKGEGKGDRGMLYDARDSHFRGITCTCSCRLWNSERVRQCVPRSVSPEAQLVPQSPACRGWRRNSRVGSVCMEGWSRVESLAIDFERWKSLHVIITHPTQPLLNGSQRLSNRCLKSDEIES